MFVRSCPCAADMGLVNGSFAAILFREPWVTAVNSSHQPDLPSDGSCAPNPRGVPSALAVVILDSAIATAAVTRGRFGY